MVNRWTLPLLYVGRVLLSFRDVKFIWSLLSYFLWKILLANNVDPDQTPHNVASDLGLHCCLWPFYGFPGKNGLDTLGYGADFKSPEGHEIAFGFRHPATGKTVSVSVKPAVNGYLFRIIEG